MSIPIGSRDVSLAFSDAAVPLYMRPRAAAAEDLVTRFRVVSGKTFCVCFRGDMVPLDEKIRFGEPILRFCG